MIKKVLTIAGSDSSGGAGIQADLKTMTALGAYGMSVITAITAQNTMGVTDIENITPKNIEAQLEAVFTDIFPDAVKIGMVSNREAIITIAKMLDKYKPRHIVLDPVMVSTSGYALLEKEAESSLIEALIPLATLITPNIPEAQILSGVHIETTKDMEMAARKIAEKYKGAILIKGGHMVSTANDLLYDKGEVTWINGTRIESENTHGTGCTLSSAIACYLSEGNDMKKAVTRAKEYLSQAITHDINLGKGSGPVNHCWNIKKDI